MGEVMWVLCEPCQEKLSVVLQIAGYVSLAGTLNEQVYKIGDAGKVKELDQ